MKDILPVTLANLRKGKSQAVSLLLFVLIAAVLLNIGLLFMMRYGDFFENKSEELHAPHYALVEEKRLFSAAQIDWLKNYPGVTEVETERAVAFGCDMIYNNGSMYNIAMFVNAETERKMNDLTLTEGNPPKTPDDICIPYMFKSGGGYRVGDTFTLTVNGEKLSFVISGFTEEIMFGSGNHQNYQHYLAPTGYAELMAKLPEWECALIRARMENPYDSEQMGIDFIKEFFFMNEFSNADSLFFHSIDWNGVKLMRTMMSDIISIILVVFAVLIVLVSLLVIRFRIHNSIEENMTNIGALKAVGYTGSQLLRAMILQFCSLTLIGAILGIGVSYIVIPSVAGILAEQTALIWTPGFDIAVSLAAFALILLAVLAVTALSARNIKSLRPLTALRQGLVTHAFKRNHFPLNRSRGPLLWLLSVKSAVQAKGQMVMIFIIITMVSFAAAVGVSIYDNLGTHPEIFAKLLAGEVPDIAFFAGSHDGAREVRDFIENDPRVRKVFYHQDVGMLIEDRVGASVIDEDFSLLEGALLYEGRYPKHDNEIALGGAAAKINNKSVGDTVKLTQGGKTETYLVVGLIQMANSGGYICALTIPGLHRMQPDYRPREMYVYLHDSKEAAAVINSVSGKYGEKLESIVNMEELTDAQLGMFGSIFRAVTAVIIAVTVLVIIMALYLMLKTVILRHRRELGIQKALGFTTLQLMNQFSLYFLPVIILGVAAGGVGGALGFNPIFIMLAQGMGIMTASMPAPIVLTAVMCAALALLAYAFSMLIAWRIRKISAYTLVSE